MIFTRQFIRLRPQVLVLDPALILTSVNVVIGDNVYELHFRVELEEMHELPKPLDLEDVSDEFDKNNEGAGGGEQGDLMQEDGSLNNAPGSKFGT
jgi:hypothetical protein